MNGTAFSRPFLACCVAAVLGFSAFSPAYAEEATPPKRLELPPLAQRPNKDAPITIVAFGSPSPQGGGASTPAHAYPAQLELDLDKLVPKDERVTVVNRGIGGEDADDMLARLDRDVIAAKPDLVIWQTGTNDPLRKLPLDRFEAETREGISRMHAAGIDVVLMEPQDCRMMRATPGSMAYLEAVRKIGAEMGVPVVRR